ncbi:MBL fold metallo-hydrolase [Aestuariibius sp. 2305UL40-4]|uniref:MBL fold metallo-hydrolase n=1 Tax=Aestuariibius violaceus TaxID=3234132 RepID=UPI00345EEE4B
MSAVADPAPTPGKIVYPWEAPPGPGEAIEVADGILWMRLPLPMALDHVNIFALDDGDGWTLIDTGFASAKMREIWAGLLSGPLGGRPVTRLIVTHHHPDHIGLAGWFQEAGAELWTTRTAWIYARMLTLDVQERPTEEAITFYRRAGMPEALIAERAEARPFNFADAVAPMPPGFRRLQQGDALQAAGRTWRVEIGHGHAPDHAVLVSESDHLILGGDQLLPSISPNIGVHPTEPEADPLAEWLASCHRFAGLAREDHLVLPGHKLPFTGLPARLRQLIDNHEHALDRLALLLETPHTAAECFPTLFKRDIKPAEYGLALAEAVAHLNHLLATGRVTRELSESGAWLWHARTSRP